MASAADLLANAARPAVGVLNHLLRGQPWLCARLAPFAGRSLRLELTPLPSLVLGIGPQGELQEAREATPDATARVSPLILARLVVGDEAARASVEVSGDTALAAAVAGVVRELRWDAEEDLSRVIGDIPAQRLVRLGEALFAWQRQALASLLANISEYLVEERHALAARVAVESWALEVDALRDDVERLAKRLERLARPDA